MSEFDLNPLAPFIDFGPSPQGSSAAPTGTDYLRHEFFHFIGEPNHLIDFGWLPGSMFLPTGTDYLRHEFFHFWGQPNHLIDFGFLPGTTGVVVVTTGGAGPTPFSSMSHFGRLGAG